MQGQNGSMTVVTPGVAKAPGNGAAAVLSLEEKIAAKRAEVARLKDTSNVLSESEAEYARLCAEENANHARLEREATERLKARAEIVESECRAALPDRGEHTEIVCLCDRSTEKAIGIGIVVVRAHAGEAAVKALATANKLTINDKGEAAFDALGTGGKSKAQILDGLLKCVVYPIEREAVDALVERAYGFALAAYEAASRLTGRHAQAVTGKSES